jgi:hypothetical protein
MLMDSLIKTNKFVMITIGTAGCDLCSDINKIVIHDSSKVTKVFLNIEHHKNNLLLAQSLFNKGYPTSYIIDKNYNLIGIIDGLERFNEQLDSIIRYKQNPINFHSIDGDVEDKNIIPTLNFTFKASINYFENDFENLNKNVRISFKYGSFFFNNYLLYEYFTHKNNADSAKYYKYKALKYNRHINTHIYKDLIDKLKANK